MQMKPTCKTCEHLKVIGRAAVTGSNRGLCGPRAQCHCDHPLAYGTFRRLLPRSGRMEGFIDFTPPGGNYPTLQTSPKWCPLRQAAQAGEEGK